jgi:DNA-binding NarL/FixJ family response regulator
MLENPEEFDLSVALSVPHLIEGLRTQCPALLLIEMTPDITLNVLGQLRVAAGDAHIVLWVDAISTEFASQAIGLGVRGILRRNLPTNLQLQCFRDVARGEMWVEKPLSDGILCSVGVRLARRESQLIGLLVQGLKNKEIAWRMGLTEATVKVYLSHVFKKVGVSDRFELALFALKNIYGIKVGDPSAAMDRHQTSVWIRTS